MGFTLLLLILAIPFLTLLVALKMMAENPLVKAIHMSALALRRYTVA